MPSMRAKAGKALWRRAAAVALAACGSVAAQDSSTCATCPPSAPTDLSQLYRDAYLNPATALPPGGAGHQPALGGEWRNPSRYRWYFGGDYVHMYRPALNKVSLTAVSNDLFWDDPLQRGSGALNAEVGAFNSGSRPQGFIQQAGDIPPLFPNLFLPNPALTGQQLTPNDDAARINVNEFLVPNAVRMSTENFDVNRGLAGFRPKIGVVLPNGDRIELSYYRMNDWKPAQLIDNVAGAGFLTKVINTGPQTGGNLFAFQRWGYLRAPFVLSQGSRTTNDFNNFRGEDVRAFAANADPTVLNTANFPHFPYNEIPQPEQTKGVGDLVPLFPPPPQPFMRGSDIPRKPTTNDFPGLGSQIFRNGELAAATVRSDLQTADLLYRRDVFTEGETGNWNVQLVGGFRFVNMNERFNYFWAQLWNFSRTTAAGPVTPLAGNTATPNIPQPPIFVPNDNGLADPVDLRGQAAEDTQVTIDRKIANNVFGPQIGFDARFPFWNYFDLQLQTKGGWMANYADTKLQVFRGDGLFYTNYGKSKLGPAGVIEGQFGMNFHPHEKFVIRAGWEYMYLMGVGTALGNLQGDLGRFSRPGTKESQFYNGWYSGVQISF